MSDVFFKNCLYNHQEWKYWKTFVVVSQLRCIVFKCMLKMKADQKNGQIDFKTWKNRFWEKFGQFFGRFSTFSIFCKLFIISDLHLLCFAQIFSCNYFNPILNLWCNHDVKPHIMEHHFKWQNTSKEIFFRSCIHLWNLSFFEAKKPNNEQKIVGKLIWAR